MEDPFQFILHHEIMWTGSDVDFAVPMVARRNCFLISALRVLIAASTALRTAPTLMKCLMTNVLPKKGRLSKADRDREQGETEEGFCCMRRQHPAVESAINNLEHRGLDRVRSKVQRDLPERLLWPSLP